MRTKLSIVVEVNGPEQASAVLKTLIDIGVRKGRIECEMKNGKTTRAAIAMPDPDRHVDLKRFIEKFRREAVKAARNT